MDASDYIIIKGARENNLKNIAVSIPKKKITMFTGVSGSGKSSLLFDTIAAESQRQLNETFSSFIRHRLPHFGQPDADVMENLSPAIIIDQKSIRGNARSTVGTITDINSLLRLLFSRIGKPFVGYSNVFSFNHPEGMCPVCEGLGTVTRLNTEKLLDKQKSLNEGAILFPTFSIGTALWKRFVLSGYFDNDKKIKEYTKKELDLLLYQEQIKPDNPAAGWWPSAMYEGIVPRFTKRYFHKENGKDIAAYSESLKRLVSKQVCPKCNGARLNTKVLNCRINGQNIADYSGLQIVDLLPVIKAIESTTAATVKSAIAERLDDLVTIGLGYLSLNRQTSTLSGGESQRVKMVRHLGSSLSDMTYILDEPSTGLHAKDVNQLNILIESLRDKGNTVLVVEHDPDVIRIADYVIDMGPAAGNSGGNIMFEGPYNLLLKSDTITGRALKKKPRLKAEVRTSTSRLYIKNAVLNNLKNVNAVIPLNVMTVVTGVAGSGKSSLINAFKAHTADITYIDQNPISGSKRSNPATYIGISDMIRNSFASANKVSNSLFSANSEGACPACKGLGVISTDLAFMDPVVTTCELCNGRRFNKKVLNYKLNGKNIDDVLRLTFDEAGRFFMEDEILESIRRVNDVGLSYLTLGQPLNSLSGGERQRIKLASSLDQGGTIYILDEPSTGLHLSDVENLIALMDRLIDKGNTVIVVEHNLDIIARADWIIDMGPGAGRDGGQVVFQGTPAEIIREEQSATGLYLEKYINRHK